MATWWLAIDKNFTSYAELKHRKIIAQGWPDIGNILTLCPLVPKGSRCRWPSKRKPEGDRCMDKI